MLHDFGGLRSSAVRPGVDGRHRLSTSGNPRIDVAHYPDHPQDPTGVPRPPKARARRAAEAAFLGIGPALANSIHDPATPVMSLCTSALKWLPLIESGKNPTQSHHPRQTRHECVTRVGAVNGQDGTPMTI